MTFIEDLREIRKEWEELERLRNRKLNKPRPITNLKTAKRLAQEA